MDAAEVDFYYEEKKWAPLIGKFILDFANIEEFLHVVIHFYFKETLLDEEDIPDNLLKRIKLFEKVLLNRILVEASDKEKLAEAVSKVRQLIPIRNLVAHNSLGLVVEEDAEGAMRIGGFEITGRKKKEVFLNYESLSEKVKQLEFCRNQLSELLLVFYAVLKEEKKRKDMAGLLRQQS